MSPKRPATESTAHLADLRFGTDEALIGQAQKDPRAFEGLYDKYYTAIFNFILRRVNDRQTTADITQQVFFNALTHLKSYKHRGFPYSAFLHRIAINECNQYFRDRKKLRFVPLTGEYTSHLGQEFSWSDREDADLFVRLKKGLMELEHHQLLLLELRFFEKKAFSEIAFLLNITENLAKVKTYRVLDKLKSIIEKSKDLANNNR